jgi:hypothetical protein
MEQPQSGTVPPERIRYRLTLLQRGLSMLPAMCMIMIAQFSLWLNGGPTDVVLLSLLAGAVVPFMPLLGVRSFGITLTASAAVVHGLRRRTVPWSDVQAVMIEPLLGSRTVVIHEAGGRRTRLRAPITGFLSWDSDFEEKFHTIGRWWLEHRGPDWVPVPPPWAWWIGPPASAPSGEGLSPEGR